MSNHDYAPSCHQLVLTYTKPCCYIKECCRIKFVRRQQVADAGSLRINDIEKRVLTTTHLLLNNTVKLSSISSRQRRSKQLVVGYLLLINVY